MIQFTDDYRATADQFGIQLQQRKYRKNKDNPEMQKEVWVNVSYHGTYEQAAIGLVDRKIRMCKSAEEIIEAIKELKEMIRKIKFPKR